MVKNSPPRLKNPGGVGSLAIASVFCLVFCFYIGIPAVGHLSKTRYMVKNGVETTGVTRVCVKTRSKARIVVVDFEDAEGREWTCGGRMKADCKVPKHERQVVYDPANPAQCMIGPMALFEGLATGVLGPVAAAGGFFAGFLLFGFQAIKRRRMRAEAESA